MLFWDPILYSPMNVRLRTCALPVSFWVLLWVHPSSTVASASPQTDLSAPLPAAHSFLNGVREAIRLNDELQQDFMYVEDRRDVRITKLGKVEVGPRRTFEVYPSNRPGRTYKRLIAIDGKPLDPEELARRDREHADNVRK